LLYDIFIIFLVFPQDPALMFESLVDALERELQVAIGTAVTGLVAAARTQFEDAVAEISKERAKGRAELDVERADLHREIEAMHKHREAQEGRVNINIGGYNFETSVQTLRRVPHTFFDAYFSGRYSQDVCRDGSIFVDRDGEHFGHILEYMRDGVLSVAEPGAQPSVDLLRKLKREFGFYCIDLAAEQLMEPEQIEFVYVMGGDGAGGLLQPTMEKYDTQSEHWSVAAKMGTARDIFGACSIEGELYVTGGRGDGNHLLSSVEKYSPADDTWSVVAPLPGARSSHAAIAVGSAIYVLGGNRGVETLTTTLKYDIAQGSWSEVAPMPAGRWGVAACAVGRDIFVFGGVCSANQLQASVFKFDTEANEWTTLAPMSSASCHHSASVLNGSVYIVGAGNGREVLRYDPSSGAWSTLAPKSHGRQGGYSFALDGRLYVAGGHNSSSSVERYDTASNTWTTVEDMLEGRRFFGAVTIQCPAEEQDVFNLLITKAIKQRARADGLSNLASKLNGS
jgi:N-acetylneuraminic acid mutarotase